MIPTHYIKEEFLKKFSLLSYALFEKTHTGIHLVEKLSEILKEWGLEKQKVKLIESYFKRWTSSNTKFIKNLNQV